MVSSVPLALAAEIASRKEQSASQVPSLVSSVLLTVKPAIGAAFAVGADKTLISAVAASRGNTIKNKMGIRFFNMCETPVCCCAALLGRVCVCLIKLQLEVTLL